MRISVDVLETNVLEGAVGVGGENLMRRKME
jgi:hypothetical protein